MPAEVRHCKYSTLSCLNFAGLKTNEQNHTTTPVKHRRVIFLDIDGVLNSAQTCTRWEAITGVWECGGYFHERDLCRDDNVMWGPDLVQHLKRMVEETNACIVISSTWREFFSVEKFVEMFAVYGWHQAPVIDKTPSSDFTLRGQEINAWLYDNPVAGYVIIDDTDSFLEEQSPYFVQTDPEVGLSATDVDKAIAILKGFKKIKASDKLS